MNASGFIKYISGGSFLPLKWKKINLDDACTTSLTLLLQPYSLQIKLLDRLLRLQSQVTLVCDTFSPLEPTDNVCLSAFNYFCFYMFLYIHVFIRPCKSDLKFKKPSVL